MNPRLGYRLGSFPKHRRRVAFVALLLVAAACACAPGCVRRRLTVRTTPPGALVYIDGQYIGATPVSTDFTYYGTRKIELIKDGYETQTVKQEFAPPWYEYPPLDFINENLNPREIRDERELHFTLAAQRIVTPNELLGRGDYLRGSASSGNVTPLPRSGGGAWGTGSVDIAPPPGSLPGLPPPGEIAPTQTWVGPSQQELPPEAISEGYARPPAGATFPLRESPLAPSEGSFERDINPSPAPASRVWSGFGGF